MLDPHPIHPLLLLPVGCEVVVLVVVPAVDVVGEPPHVLLEVLYGEFRPLADEAALQLSEGREYGEEHAPRRRGGAGGADLFAL